MAQVEIITGKERRRGWSRERKEAVLAEAFAPGVNVKAFARSLDISTSLLYKWRRSLWKPKPAGFAQVIAVADAVLPALPAPAMTPASAGELPAIEIELGGNKVRIPPTMPVALASAVVRAMVRP